MSKFKKGQSGNLKGKPKGIQNKTTSEAKALFNSVMNGEIEHIKSSLELVRTKDPAKYLDILAKYLNYIYPKGLDVTTDGEKIGDIIDLSNLSDDQFSKLGEILNKG